MLWNLINIFFNWQNKPPASRDEVAALFRQELDSLHLSRRQGVGRNTHSAKWWNPNFISYKKSYILSKSCLFYETASFHFKSPCYSTWKPASRKTALRVYAHAACDPLCYRWWKQRENLQHQLRTLAQGDPGIPTCEAPNPGKTHTCLEEISRKFGWVVITHANKFC